LFASNRKTIDLGKQDEFDKKKKKKKKKPAQDNWQMLQGVKLGFIGGGSMGEAIVRGVLGSGVLSESKIMVCDRNASRKRFFESTLNVASTGDGHAVVDFADVVVVAVKPQHTGDVVPSLAGDIKRLDRLLVSVVAGQSLAHFASLLGDGGDRVRMVRVMPNTPCMIGEGACGVFAGQHARDRDVFVVRALMQACAKSVVSVDSEDALHAVTAVSGSGPAYVFRFIEALVRGGVEQGLDKRDALALATQTVVGAGLLCRREAELGDDGLSPAQLRERVTSKGGTTAAALRSLSANHFDDIVVDGMHACSARSRQLAGEPAVVHAAAASSSQSAAATTTMSSTASTPILLLERQQQRQHREQNSASL
jgi:pyrroline-5-carboxylate reductase